MLRKQKLIAVSISCVLASQSMMAHPNMRPFNANSKAQSLPIAEDGLQHPSAKEKKFDQLLKEAINHQEFDQIRSILTPKSLIKVIQKKDHKTLDIILNHVPQAVQYQDEQGNSALHWAARINDITSIDLLLNHGASLYLKNHDGMIPSQWADSNHVSRSYGYLTHTLANLEHQLISAIMNHDFKSVIRLTHNGANLNYQDINGNHSLNIAIQNGHTDIAMLLIKQGADVNRANWQGSTPLHEACFHGHLDIIKALIAAKSNINQLDEHKMTPLHNAALNGHAVIVNMLLDHKANKNIKDVYGKTALDDAKKFNHSDVIRLLDGTHTYHISTEQFQQWIAELPLEQVQAKTKKVRQGDLSALIRSSDANGRTALHIAAAYGDVAKIDWLLSHGAIINALKHDLESPLHEAAWEGQEAAIKALLKQGANMEQSNKFGLTALHISSWKGHHDITKCLLNHGANVNALNQHSWTPLHYAVKFNRPEVAQLLLDAGANLYAKENKHQQSPLEMARERNAKDIVGLLESKARSPRLILKDPIKRKLIV